MYARKKKRLALEKRTKQIHALARLWQRFEPTDYVGIDYRGPRWTMRARDYVNQNGEFHHGIIHMNALSGWAWDSMEFDYGEPTCPKCGNEAVDAESDAPLDEMQEGETEENREHDREALGYETLHHACGDYACDSCRILFDGEDAYSDEALGHGLDDGEYVGRVNDNGYLHLVRSPYYTLTQFCSPCYPGAGNMDTPCITGIKTYCLREDWFEDQECPYPIWSCKTGKLVWPK